MLDKVNGMSKVRGRSVMMSGRAVASNLFPVMPFSMFKWIQITIFTKIVGVQHMSPTYLV